MKNSPWWQLLVHIPKLAIVTFLLAIPLSGAVAQLSARQRSAASASTTLVSSVFAAGTGGNAMTSANFRMLGVLGETGLPANQTTLSSQNFQLQPGFLAQLSTTGVRLFLPLALLNYCSTCEVEPNNTIGQANGPLQSGIDYYGYPDDHDDYFSFSTAGGVITLDLNNTSGQGTQLMLYFQSTANLVGFAGVAPYHISLPRQSGLYYVRVYTASAFNLATRYTLRVTYP